jgi:cytochrome c5
MTSWAGWAGAVVVVDGVGADDWLESCADGVTETPWQAAANVATATIVRAADSARGRRVIPTTCALLCSASRRVAGGPHETAAWRGGQPLPVYPLGAGSLTTT